MGRKPSVSSEPSVVWTTRELGIYSSGAETFSSPKHPARLWWSNQIPISLPFAATSPRLTIQRILYTWFRASWIEFNNCPIRCNLFSLLYFCRQLYMFRVLTPITRSSYNCNYSFWYWLTWSSTIRSRCWVGKDSCVSYSRHESFPTQQRERMVVDQVNPYPTNVENRVSS